MNMNQRVRNGLAVLVSLVLGACADVPTRDNLGYVYTTTVSACRAGRGPNDKCVAEDLNRCKALVDYTNPGRSEAVYTGLINGISTLIGTVVGYAVAEIGNRSLEAVTGTIAGSSAGTALTYNIVLYRGAVEACMFSLGRDPKLTEQYFGLVKYNGKVQEFTKAAEKLAPKKQ